MFLTKDRHHCIVAAFFALTILAAGAPAQVTSLTLNSDPGDYIGAGQFLFFTPADGTFGASQNYDQGVSLSFNTPNYSHWWYLDFGAANNQPLAVGTYTGATRFAFHAPDENGLDIYGDGRGCNTLTGSFTVLEISYGANSTINAYDAIFEQHCEGQNPALHGEIRYNAHPAVTITAPTRLNAVEGQAVHFTASATDIQSRHVALSAVGVPAGATFVDNGNNTGTFNWPASVSGNYLLTLQGDNLSGNIGATYTAINVTAQNDDFDNAIVISSLPFTKSEDASSATAGSDDPYGCYGSTESVWFAFRPNRNMRLEANTFGSDYDSTLAVFTGSRGALTQVSCDDDAGGGVQSRVRFDATAGTTYYFMVSALYRGASANLVFNLLPGPPPLTIVPTLTQFGSINPTTGAVTLSGFVTASQPTYVSISGELKQNQGGRPLDGFFSAYVPCNQGTNPWSVDVQSYLQIFHGRSAALYRGGKAIVTATVSAYDPDSGEYIERNLSATVTLRGKK